MKRFNLKNVFFGVLALSGAVLFTSCDKDNDIPVPAPLPNIVDKVVATPEFSLLKFAVIRAGLASALSTGDLTVFAPDDAAFARAGLPDTNAIKTIAPNALADILKYHVLTSRITAANVPAGPNTSVGTLLAANNIFATRTSSGSVFINGGPVTAADITASNGVIHKIDRVLMPASGNIVSTLQANSKYNRLVQAAVKCNLGAALSAPGPLTIFAPDNAAFVAAGFDSAAIANANAATVTTLTNVLLLHVYSGRAFSSDISNGLAIPSLFTPKTLTFAINGSVVTVKETASVAANASTIVGVNKVTTNGVIHDVNKVILP